MVFPLPTDIGFYIKGANALEPNVVTAGSGGDGAEQNGITIDRYALGSRYRSAKVIIPISATLASGEDLEVASNVQDSANGSSWNDFGTAPSNFTLNALNSGAEQHTVFEYDINLETARRYVRIQATPTLSASGTDVVAIAGVMVFGGAEELPAT